MKVLLAEMRWPEIKARIQTNAVAVIPVASTEQHGPHLPLQTDARIVTDCAIRAAERVADELPIVVAPTVSYGFSEHHMDFSGTMSLSMPTYIAVLAELTESLIRGGFPRVLLLNGHGGNCEAIQVAARHVVARQNAVVGAATYWDVAAAALASVNASEVGMVPGHSSGFETACMLALKPELVELAAMPSTDESVPLPNDSRVTLAGFGVAAPGYATYHPPSGVWGDPRLLKAERGPAFVEAIVRALADLYRAFSRTDGYGVR
jgi:creatinine amidohydrolase